MKPNTKKNMNFHGKLKLPNVKPRFYLFVALALIILYVLAATFLFNSVYTVSSTTKVALAANSSMIIALPNDPAQYALFVRSVSSSSAVVYISKYPILQSGVEYVTLGQGGSVNVSLTSPSYASVNIRLANTTDYKASLVLTYLSQSLGIRQSSSVMPLTSFQQSQQQSSGTQTNSTSTQTNSTNLQSNASGSSTSTSSSSGSNSTNTSSSNNQAQIYASVMKAANNTAIGALMIAQKALYNQIKSCTPQQYNTTYTSVKGKAPKDAFTFQNMSSVTPTDITWNVSTLTAGSLYSVLYKTVSPNSHFSGAALNLEMEYPSNYINSQTFEGAYYGLNYTTLNKSYAYQKSIGNACGALIPYSG